MLIYKQRRGNIIIHHDVGTRPIQDETEMTDDQKRIHASEARFQTWLVRWAPRLYARYPTEVSITVCQCVL